MAVRIAIERIGSLLQRWRRDSRCLWPQIMARRDQKAMRAPRRKGWLSFVRMYKARAALSAKLGTSPLHHRVLGYLSANGMPERYKVAQQLLQSIGFLTSHE